MRVTRLNSLPISRRLRSRTAEHDRHMLHAALSSDGPPIVRKKTLGGNKSPISAAKDKAQQRRPTVKPLSCDKDFRVRRTRGQTFRPRQDDDPPPAEYFDIPNASRLPMPMGDFLEIYMTEGRGRGVRTTKSEIPAGTVLHTENAAILGLPCYLRENEKKLAKRIRQAVANSLSHEQISKFLSLTHAGLSDTEESRFLRNCFEDWNVDSIKAAATSCETKPEHISCLLNLWLDISMINHSCRPNVIVLVTDADTGTAVLIAVEDIPIKGTEIHISYLFGEEPGCVEELREVRQQTLQRGWGFVCACDACGSPGEAAEQQRSRESSLLSDDGATSRDLGLIERPDERLEYINDLGKKLGMIELTGNEDQHETTVKTFEDFFSQYEMLLQKERMAYRLCSAHEKALDMYRLHWLDNSQDELTFAKILYHREQFTKYTRICYGTEEAAKSAQEYAKELKKQIKRPKRQRKDMDGDEDLGESGNKRKRMRPSKGTVARMPKPIEREVVPLGSSESSSSVERPVRKLARPRTSRTLQCSAEIPPIPTRRIIRAASGSQSNPITISDDEDTSVPRSTRRTTLLQRKR